MKTKLQINSPNIKYLKDEIISQYQYETVDTKVQVENGVKYITATPKKTTYQFKTQTTVPKVGVMIVGLGGNNGTTFTGGILANQK